MLKIALGHQSRVGKDTVAYMITRILGPHECTRVAFADPLYEITENIQEVLGVSRGKDPALLQSVGMGLRGYRQGVFVDHLVNRVKAIPRDNHIIVTDVRFKNEFDALKDLGFIMVKVVRPERPIDRDPDHPSETELTGDIFDHVIVNKGTLEDLSDEVVRFIISWIL